MARHLTELSDDDLRTALFDALAERLDAQAQEDRSINFVNRMPTVLAISRRGNLLTLSQGIGHWLLRGDLKCKDRRERQRTFSVSRATLQSRLIITPDRVEGTPDEILDRIQAMFLEWTGAADETRPVPPPALQATQSAPLARQESRPAGRVAENRPTVRETTQEARVTSAESTRQPRPAPSRTSRESRRAPIVPMSTKAAPSPPAPVRKTPTATLRTYQLLFETARREVAQATSLPADNRHFLLSAGVFVALTAEAFFNDLGSRVIPSWSQLQRLDSREKAEVLSIELFNGRVDWSVRPFQSIAAALGFRRALAHAHAEALSFDEPRAADQQSGEVPRTRRTAWPEHCEVATIERWIADVRLMIERFSCGYDPSEVPVDRRA
jgi:hypothetical protein